VQPLFGESLQSGLERLDLGSGIWDLRSGIWNLEFGISALGSAFWYIYGFGSQIFD
jgi:hypothetical protein